MLLGPRDTSPTWTLPRRRNVGLCAFSRLKLFILVALCALLAYSAICLLSRDIDGVFDTSPVGVQAVTNVGKAKPAGKHGSGITTPSKQGQFEHWKGKLAALNPWRKHHGRPKMHPAAKAPHSVVHHAPSPTAPGRFSTQEAELIPVPHRDGNKSGHSIPSISASTIIPVRLSLGERARVGKCTILFGGPNTVYDRALRAHERHDRIHNYPLHVLRQTMLDDVWSKPAYILMLLMQELAKPPGERLDWLLWVDADTVILNPLVPVETFLPPDGEFDEVHMLVTHDWNGLNNGVFPVRVCQWSVELFSSILAFRIYRPESQLVFRDQSAMDTLLQEPHFAKHVVEVPQRWFNAYQGEHNETLNPNQVRRGDFLVHFAGVGDRDQRMVYWLERAERHTPDWEVEVQHTSYPQEVRDFWSEMEMKREERKKEVEHARKALVKLMEQIHGQMDDHRYELDTTEAEYIDITLHDASEIVDQEASKSDLESIQKAVEGLKNVTAPLNAKEEEMLKSAVKEAHEVIFSAEQSAFTETDSAEAQEAARHVQDQIWKLKEKLMEPHLQKSEMDVLLGGLRDAQKELDGRIKAEMEEKEKAAKEEAEKEKEASNAGQSVDSPPDANNDDKGNADVNDESNDEENDTRPEWDEESRMHEDNDLFQR